MIKRIVCLILTIFAFITSVGQENHEFLGVLKLKDTTLISYRLNLELSGNKVSGYSVTSIGGPHETKSYISGTYNASTNLLEFREYGIEYTKSDVDTYDFCFLHFSGKVRNLENQNTIEGNFIGKYEDGVACIDGSLMVKSLERIYKKAKRTDKKIQKLKAIPDSVKSKVSLKNVVDEKRINVLKANERTSIFLKPEKFSIKIYDAGKLDGDRIKLVFNGKVLLSGYEISKEAKTLELPMDKDINEIKVYALNVGKIAPNTAKIEILQGDKTIQLLSNLQENSATTLILHKSKG